jgi:hypothetical protein
MSETSEYYFPMDRETRRYVRLAILTLVLHSTASLADALTDRVAAAFNQEDPKLQATIKSDDEIHLTAPIGSLSIFLDHIRAECTKRPNDCDSLVKQFVQSTVASARVPDAMKFNADNVYPVIRAENVAATARTMSRATSLPAERQIAAIRRPMACGFAATTCALGSLLDT